MRAIKSAAVLLFTCCAMLALSISLMSFGQVSSLAPASAFADEGAVSAEGGSDLVVRGTDTLQIGGDSFECATVAGLAGDTLYADILVDDKVVTADMEYHFQKADDTFGVVQLDAKASYLAKHSGNITLSFYKAKTADRQGAAALQSLKAYAVCMQVDGKPMGSIEQSMIGIRTSKASEAELAITAPTQIVRGDNTYRLVGSNKVAPTLKDGVLYVSYEKVDEGTSTTASVVYVDEEGNTLDSDSYSIAKGEEKSVKLRSSVEVDNKVYTPLAASPEVKLSAESPEQRIYCVAQAEADTSTQEVALKYVDADGKQLMADRVNVGAGGYLYAPATIFSQAKNSEVKYYVLDGAADSLGNKYSAKEAQELSLTRDGAKEYTLTYKAKETDLDYTVNFALVSAGKNGNTQVELYKSEKSSVSSAKAAEISLPESLEKDGVAYKRSGNENKLSYAWSDLKTGRLLSDTVYYVSSDVVAPSAYDVKVRYVDAVSGAELGSSTLTCDPNAAALSITSPESVDFEGSTYQRLSGQSAPITHRFYDPYRTYTVYYALPGAIAKGDVTVTRTQIIDGGIRYYIIDSDGKVTTNGTATQANSGTTTGARTTGGLLASTPYTSVATTNVNGSSAQTGNATAPSGDSAYTERIVDANTPLAAADSAQDGPNFALIAAGVVALLILAALAFFLIRKKRAQQANDGIGA